MAPPPGLGMSFLSLRSWRPLVLSMYLLVIPSQANTGPDRPSTRHVLCPWDGTSSRCPASQFSRTS